MNLITEKNYVKYSDVAINQLPKKPIIMCPNLYLSSLDFPYKYIYHK